MNNAMNVSDQLGSGGTGLAPAGSGPTDGLPTLPALLRLAFGSIWQPYATTAAMQAAAAQNLADGQLAVRLSDYSVWVYEAGSTATPSSTCIQPTAVTGAGRFVQITVGSGGTVVAVTGGTSTLVAGVSPAIAAPITASSRILVTRQALNASPALGFLSAEPGDRVVGSPGSFKVRSLSAVAAAVTTDVSSFDWLVIG